MTVDTDRLALLDGVPLSPGAHSSLEDGVCILEAVAFVAGEPWSDHPSCASKVIGEFLRSWNDALNDRDRQMLAPLIPKLVGTSGTDAQEMQRSWMALDWYCRISTPAWLRVAGLTAEAEAIEATAPIIDRATAKAAQDALDAARSAAYKAGDAAGDDARGAAWDATRDAARDAAWGAASQCPWGADWDDAWDADWDDAWGTAWDASWDAARGAVRGAARGAARAALRPTVERLQKSAIELTERMIAVTSEASS